MKSLWLFACTATLLTSVAGTAHALEFKAVGANPIIMYDAPSLRGHKMFVAPRGMPVEIVLSYGDWSKVRDSGGDLLWVQNKGLAPKRNVIVRVANAKIRVSADDNAATVFSADRNVLLELLEPAVAPGWFKVKHRDGQSGYVKSADVWGT